MNFYPLWPYFVSLPVLVGLVATPLFAATDRPVSRVASRQSNIDGLRGFLAFGVFFGHAALYHQFITDGSWSVVPVPALHSLLAQCGVALFLMITGYLFWGKLLKERGKPNWPSLYVSRVFRVGPLYMVACAMMLFLVAVRSNFTPQENITSILKEIAGWALLGAQQDRPDINGYHRTWLITAGVTWTLALEWRFYLALLLLSIAARSRTLSSMFVTVALFGGWFSCRSTQIPATIPRMRRVRSSSCAAC